MQFLTDPKLGRAMRVAAFASLAAFVAGCTTTPWTDNYQPLPQPRASLGAPGVLAGYYRVNPGDTLAGIAGAFGRRPDEIAAWNHLPPNAAVTPGQVLRVAPPLGPTALPPVQIGAAPMQPIPSQPAPPATMLTWPARGAVTGRFVPGSRDGITITAPANGDHTVRAAAGGRVVYAGTGLAKYGPLVIVKHENGLITAYGHAGRLLVNEGDAVSAGQPVAEMATGPDGRASFEFEVRQNGKPVDPLAFLPQSGG